MNLINIDIEQEEDMVSYCASSGKCITGLKLRDGELKGGPERL